MAHGSSSRTLFRNTCRATEPLMDPATTGTRSPSARTTPGTPPSASLADAILFGDDVIECLETQTKTTSIGRAIMDTTKGTDYLLGTNHGNHVTTAARGRVIMKTILGKGYMLDTHYGILGARAGVLQTHQGTHPRDPRASRRPHQILVSTPTKPSTGTGDGDVVEGVHGQAALPTHHQPGTSSPTSTTARAERRAMGPGTPSKDHSLE